MIIYVDIKNGKVDLTKEQLEKLLKEKYNEGYNEGKKFFGSCTTTVTCPYYNTSCPHYWSWKPNWYYTTADKTISTTNDTTTTQTISSDNIITGTATTGTISINCREVD